MAGSKPGGAVALGQVLAALVTVTNVSSKFLADAGVSMPTVQSALNYYLLAVVYGALWWRRGGRLKAAWYQYAALSLVDVEGNYALVLAYRYTSITSVTLLDSATIPFVLVLSTVFLQANYRRGHLEGSLLCILGLAVLLSADVAAGEAGGGENPLLGDVLVLVGSALYAVCNVGQEKMLGEVDAVELLAMTGAWGSLWGTLQVALLERRELEAVVWSPAVAIPMAAFAGALFLFYTLVPILLRRSGSAVLNLSLLSSDVWAAAARVVLFGGFRHAWEAGAFFGALATVSLGILRYSRSGEVYSNEAEFREYEVVGGASIIGGEVGGGGGCDQERDSGDSEGGELAEGVREEGEKAADPTTSTKKKKRTSLDQK